MQENDPLAKGYNFDQISSDAIREQQRRETAAALNTVILQADNKVLPPNRDTTRITAAVSSLGENINPSNSSILLSEPYDTFVSDTGIEIESRILRVGPKGASPYILSAGFGGMKRDKYLDMSSALSAGGYLKPAYQKNEVNILFLVASAKGQLTINENNIKFGALQKSDGVTEFFRLGKLSESEDNERSLFLAALASYAGVDGDVAREILVAETLDGVQEQALVSEFEKATKVLKEKAAQQYHDLHHGFSSFAGRYPIRMSEDIVSEAADSGERGSNSVTNPADNKSQDTQGQQIIPDDPEDIK